jgi:hypothetical protein
MRDELDDILRNRLHDVEIREGLPDWERIERSVIAAEKGEKRKKTFFLLSGYYRYAAVGLLLIGLGYVGYKFLDKETQDKYVAGDVNREVVQKSSNPITTEDMGVENNTPQVDNNPVNEVSPYSIITTTVNESLSAVPPSSLFTNRTDEDDLSNKNDLPENSLSNFAPFLATTPVLPSLEPSKSGLIDNNEPQLYDIDEYLAGFDRLYGEEDGENTSNMWHAIFLADALAVNRSNISTDIGSNNNLSINSYIGNVYEDKGLIQKFDNILLDTYAEQIGIIMSTDNYYERLINQFPISLSLGVSGDIGTRTGIESGFLYSFLKSHTGIISWNSIYFDQKLQYLGVPVTLYYSLLPENSNWDIDLRGGVTAERALSAIGTTTVYENYIIIDQTVDKEVPTNIMLSTHAGVGFGYTLFRNFGLYAEPAFEYYFYTKGQPVSYKTDNPFRFNIRAGARFSF